MKPDQRAVYAKTVAGRRGSVPANVLVWLHSPDLAARAQKLGELVRYETTLGPRWSELAILVVARHWTCHYEWAVHRIEADRAGVPDDVVEAIAERREPTLEDETDLAVFRFASTLVESGRVPEEVYRAAVLAVGQKAVVELVALVGYYTMVAFTLNAFEVPPPAGSPGLAAP
ncbi:MAG: carboxymuconolactone decarboxylase family protein [Acidobacteria bacterium]|nr:carboxymuconolactone decarboxylase family protein [Acidobacteriota bacterium]